MQTGWQEYNGKKYYFNAQGEMQIGWRTYNGKKYYFNEDGVLQTGVAIIGLEIYNFDKDGVLIGKASDGLYENGNEVLQTGWQTIDGKTYHFNGQGVMQTGETIIGSKKYSFDRNGVYIGEDSAGLVEKSTVTVGDRVKFGNYEQDDNFSNGEEAITWQVLAKENGKLLLISDRALDCKQYNKSYESVTWETCTLRKWLNNDFYNTAFSPSEKSRIQTTTVINDGNSEYGTKGGNNTKDKVFLLSPDETVKYFDCSEDTRLDFGAYPELCCEPTIYAENHGLPYTDAQYSPGGRDEAEYDYDYYCDWWLRSPDRREGKAKCVGQFGGTGWKSVDHEGGVRPVIWITE